MDGAQFHSLRVGEAGGELRLACRPRHAPAVFIYDRCDLLVWLARHLYGENGDERNQLTFAAESGFAGSCT